MGKDVALNLPLAALNNLDVSLHTGLGEVLSEQVGDVGIGVEATELEGRRETSAMSLSVGVINDSQ